MAQWTDQNVNILGTNLPSSQIHAYDPDFRSITRKILFLDDPVDSQFRSRFEREISHAIADPIPVVVLVIRGGLETVRQGQPPFSEKFGGGSFLCLVHHSVVHNRIPVVLFDGTGGCCDLFGKVDHLHREHHLKRTDDERMRTKVREKTRAMLDELKRSSEDVDRQIDPLPLIFDSIDNASIYLTLIDFKNDHHFRGDVDLAILQALLNGNRRPINVKKYSIAIPLQPCRRKDRLRSMPTRNACS
jgi:hypothetical protein